MATGAVLALFWVLVALIGAVAALAFVLGLRGSGLAVAALALLLGYAPHESHAVTVGKSTMMVMPGAGGASAITYAEPGLDFGRLVAQPVSKAAADGLHLEGDFQRLLGGKSNLFKGVQKVPVGAVARGLTRAVPLVGGAVMAADAYEWLVESGLRWNSETGQWEWKSDSTVGPGVIDKWYANGYTGYGGPSASASCASSGGAQPGNPSLTCTATLVSTDDGGATCHASCSNGYESDFRINRVCPQWSTLTPDGRCQVNPCPDGGQRDTSSGQCTAAGNWTPYSPEQAAQKLENNPPEPENQKRIYDALIGGGGAVDLAPEDDPAEGIKGSGPSTVQGPTTSTTTPAGTTTTQVTYNITYVNNVVNIVQNTTTTNPDGSTSSGGGDPEDVTPPTDPDMPPVPDLYEQKYPDGLKGVWDSGVDALKQTPIFTFLQSLVPTFADGGCPQWQLPVMYGINNYGMADVSIPCWVWSAIRAIVIVSAALACRRIIFGG